MEFKERLKYLFDNISINNKRVTSYRIEKETSINRTSIDNYLAGRQIPSIEIAIKIAQYFNVSMDWLLTGEGSMQKEPPILKNTITQEDVTVSAEAWHVIKQQAESLAKQSEILVSKEKQMQELISLLKKNTTSMDGNDKCDTTSEVDLGK